MLPDPGSASRGRAASTGIGAGSPSPAVSTERDGRCIGGSWSSRPRRPLSPSACWGRRRWPRTRPASRWSTASRTERRRLRRQHGGQVQAQVRRLVPAHLQRGQQGRALPQGSRGPVHRRHPRRGAVNLATDDDLTLVGTRQVDKVLPWDSMLPPDAIDPTGWLSCRHAADVGSIVLSRRDDSIIGAPPNVFVQGTGTRGRLRQPVLLADGHARGPGDAAGPGALPGGRGATARGHPSWARDPATRASWPSTAPASRSDHATVATARDRSSRAAEAPQPRFWLRRRHWSSATAVTRTAPTAIICQ